MTAAAITVFALSVAREHIGVPATRSLALSSACAPDLIDREGCLVRIVKIRCGNKHGRCPFDRGYSRFKFRLARINEVARPISAEELIF